MSGDYTPEVHNATVEDILSIVDVKRNGFYYKFDYSSYSDLLYNTTSYCPAFFKSNGDTILVMFRSISGQTLGSGFYAFYKIDESTGSIIQTLKNFTNITFCAEGSSGYASIEDVNSNQFVSVGGSYIEVFNVDWSSYTVSRSTVNVPEVSSGGYMDVSGDTSGKYSVVTVADDYSTVFYKIDMNTLSIEQIETMSNSDLYGIGFKYSSPSQYVAIDCVCDNVFTVTGALTKSIYGSVIKVNSSINVLTNLELGSSSDWGRVCQNHSNKSYFDGSKYTRILLYGFLTSGKVSLSAKVEYTVSSETAVITVIGRTGVDKSFSARGGVIGMAGIGCSKINQFLYVQYDNISEYTGSRWVNRKLNFPVRFYFGGVNSVKIATGYMFGAYCYSPSTSIFAFIYDKNFVDYGSIGNSPVLSINNCSKSSIGKFALPYRTVT